MEKFVEEQDAAAEGLYELDEEGDYFDDGSDPDIAYAKTPAPRGEKTTADPEIHVLNEEEEAALASLLGSTPMPSSDDGYPEDEEYYYYEPPYGKPPVYYPPPAHPTGAPASYWAEAPAFYPAPQSYYYPPYAPPGAHPTGGYSGGYSGESLGRRSLHEPTDRPLRTSGGRGYPRADARSERPSGRSKKPEAHKGESLGRALPPSTLAESHTPTYYTKRPCNFYFSKGSCKYGDSCRFSHDAAP
eukprot:TRINITY_DN141549_c0_g1_i1.p1 TRINITY_DN141549_c0_g1~~TRINITY_DN141549_c0_g1_i1.p1  ORF type:complete len:267 (-),score=-5.08 TRINITY_DN141549_c0_g1_i1:70-801(-)